MASSGNDEHAALSELARLHREIDRDVRELEERHRDRLECRRGCSGCCIDGLAVYSVEAERIRRDAASLIGRANPHDPGACAFLGDDGACRIYDSRPYVCRTQGLPLRWLEAGDEGHGATELRDICPLNEAGEPITSLDADECWTIGPVEGRLAELESRFTGDRPRRVPLRSLFERTAAD